MSYVKELMIKGQLSSQRHFASDNASSPVSRSDEHVTVYGLGSRSDGHNLKSVSQSDECVTVGWSRSDECVMVGWSRSDECVTV